MIEHAALAATVCFAGFSAIIFVLERSRLNKACENSRSENDDLKSQLLEAHEMARKPLTEAQLNACLKANGMECPRCGNDYTDLIEREFEGWDDEVDVHVQVATCNECNEKWRLLFKLNAVEPVED